MEASPLFIEMVGHGARRCAFAILTFGYTFDVALLSLVFSSIFCRALEFRITYFVGWATLIIGL
jgi:hypothetical protein